MSQLCAHAVKVDALTLSAVLLDFLDDPLDALREFAHEIGT